MSFLIGYSHFKGSSDRSKPVAYDPARLLNPHLAIMGGSGTGKTRLLRALLAHYAPRLNTIHVVDVHGDLDIPGAETVTFGETEPYGLNPLSISPDPTYGGVRRRVSSFLRVLHQSTKSKPGQRQEAALRNLLYDFYSAHGFEFDNARSWRVDFDPRQNPPSPKHQPNLNEFRNFIYQKLKERTFGRGAKAIATLEKLARANRSLEVGAAKAHEDEDIDIPKLKQRSLDLFTEYLDQLETGMEFAELLKYDKTETLQSIFDRISNLHNLGIFKDRPAPFGATTRVRRYNIKPLSASEQQIFVNILAETIFLRAVQRGAQPHLSEVLLIDEFKKFAMPEPDHIINVIGFEARKFGLALWTASQDPSHWPSTLLAQIATKVILGVSEVNYPAASKTLQLKPEKFTFIRPRVTGLVQCQTEGDLSNRFFETALEYAAT